TFLELIDTAGRVNQYVLPGKEGVRSVGNFQFDQGVFVAVFPFDGLPALSRRFAQEGFAITHVFKNNEPVALGVDILFHNLFCLKVVRIWPYSFFKVCTFGLLTKFSPAVQTALSGLRPMDPWSIFGQRRYRFRRADPNKFGSAPHIHILQRDTQVGAGTELDHGLQIIYLLARDPNQIVHDLGLDLEPGVFDQFDHLFGIFLFEPIANGHLLPRDLSTWIGVLAHVVHQRIKTLFHAPADQHVDDLLDLHVAFGFQIDLHVLFVQFDLYRRIFEVEPVRDLFFCYVHRVVEDLRVYFADDVKRWHIRVVVQQSYAI